MSQPMHVALFGGSFNPPHVAHVLAATYALATGDFDRILVVPVYAHPFDKDLAPFEHRLEMCRLAMGWIPDVEISALEKDLESPSLTLRTIEAIESTHPDWSLRLMVGADVVTEAHKWHAFNEITRRAPLFVMGRVGVKTANAPAPILPDVSSTGVRALLRQSGARTDHADLRQRVPHAVLRYVDEHRLYR